MPKKKEAPFKLNKDGYYRTTFTVIDAQGNKKRIPLRDKDPFELERKLQQKKFEYERGLLVVNGNSTVEKWALEWLDTYKTNVLSKQQQRYKGLIKNYIVPQIGSLQIKDVKSHHIQLVLNSCKDMSKSHISILYNTLNNIFEKAVASDMIFKNPCKCVERPKGSSGSLRALTNDEEKTFLQVVPKHHRGIMFKLTYKCGLRPGEVRALDVSNVDLKNHRIKIKDAVESGNRKIKGTKTESGERLVPIPLDFEQELKLILPKKGLVFPSNATGKIMTEQNYNRSWHSFKRLMNIEAGATVYRNQVIAPVIDEELTPYYLRHTYCTNLAKSGVDIRTAQYLMGHSDIKVTANIYTHVNDDMLKKAQDLISAKNVPKRKLKCKNLNIIKGL